MTWVQFGDCNSIANPNEFEYKECVSLFIELYKKTVSVSYVASDFVPYLALYMANPQPVVIRFARNEKDNLSLANLRTYIKLWLRWRKEFILINSLIFFPLFL